MNQSSPSVFRWLGGSELVPKYPNDENESVILQKGHPPLDISILVTSPSYINEKIWRFNKTYGLYGDINAHPLYFAFYHAYPLFSGITSFNYMPAISYGTVAPTTPWNKEGGRAYCTNGTLAGSEIIQLIIPIKC